MVKAYSIGDVLDFAEAIEGYFENAKDGTKQKLILNAAIDIREWTNQIIDETDEDD